MRTESIVVSGGLSQNVLPSLSLSAGENNFSGLAAVV